MLNIARPDIDMPNRRRLRYLLDDRHEEVQTASCKDLGPRTRVSLAIDYWSSPNKKAFIGIVAYYISESWKYKEVLLAFEPLSSSHTGRNLALVVERVLEQYQLTDKVFAITTDNASNNGTMRETFEQALTSRHNVKWSAEVTKISCLAHVLNLSAKALLLGLKIADDSEPDETEPTASSDPLDFAPELAENTVAQTVVKVIDITCR